jgi:hypothetical protein
MTIYKIIGLCRREFVRNSYQCEKNGYITIDEHGRAVTIPRAFTEYTLYIVADENARYAIRLTEQECASYGGRLCSLGSMEVAPFDNDSKEDPYMTHLPASPLFIDADLECKLYDYDDDIDIYLHGDPETCILRFTHVGNDEARPCGYVYVNMDLFDPR